LKPLGLTLLLGAVVHPACGRGGESPFAVVAPPQSDFFNFDSNVTYPCAGSFVRYLIEVHGLAPLKAYFTTTTFDDTTAVTESRFLSAYGRSVASLWEEWRVSIR
jgi:hypothetical protein